MNTIDSNIKKMNIYEYIQNVIEPSESIQKYCGTTLKPSLKYVEYNDENWENLKNIVEKTDISKVYCIQSTYSYTFYIYNSPKHGLIEIAKSVWNGNVASVTSISYEYLVYNFRKHEIKMTFDSYLCNITSQHCSSFMTNPDLIMNQEINDLIESKKDEIQTFYQNQIPYLIDDTPEEYIKKLYITLGNINETTYFVTKTTLLSDNYDKNKEYLILFAQIDKHTFVSTHLELSM